MIEGYVLDTDYETLEKTSPKLQVINIILKQHPGAALLMMSSFSEMLVVVERVSAILALPPLVYESPNSSSPIFKHITLFCVFCIKNIYPNRHLPSLRPLVDSFKSTSYQGHTIDICTAKFAPVIEEPIAVSETIGEIAWSTRISLRAMFEYIRRHFYGSSLMVNGYLNCVSTYHNFEMILTPDTKLS